MHDDSSDRGPGDEISSGRSELDALRLVLDQISEAVIRTDPEFRILDWSSTAERMYGYSSEEALGKRFTDIVQTQHEHTDYDTVLALFREKGHWHGEAIQRGKGDRELRVLASVTLLHDADGSPVGVLAINRDVTEAYERDAALRESELRFRQFAQNSQDVFWMSDLREPRFFFVSDGYERVWGRSLASLYDDPTSFIAGTSRTSEGSVSWTTLIREMGPLLGKSLSSGARLELRLSPENAPIRLNAQQARIVLLNLVTNAAEAIGSRSGSVVVETGVSDLDTSVIESRRPDLPPHSGRYSCLVVSDDGIGIPSADLDRVFDPFYSTKFLGRGMGLASVYGIVQEGGGWIAAESVEGRGATFTVCLPIDDADDGSTTSSSGPTRPRALLAEDEFFVRRMIARLLHTIGYDVATARDGEELLALYRAAPRDIDLIVLDVNMPVMSGLDALEQIRQRDKEIPVLVCTGGVDPQIGAVVNKDPRCALLQKPFSIDDIKSHIEALTR